MTATIDAPDRSITLILQLVRINLGLVALQAITAGLFLSGYGRAVTVHAIVASALQLCALIQAVIALVMRRRLPGWIVGVSIGLFVIVMVQAGLGYRMQHWLHVPIGVGIFGGLVRQATKLGGALRPTSS